MYISVHLVRNVQYLGACLHDNICLGAWSLSILPYVVSPESPKSALRFSAICSTVSPDCWSSPSPSLLKCTHFPSILAKYISCKRTKPISLIWVYSCIIASFTKWYRRKVKTIFEKDWQRSQKVLIMPQWVPHSLDSGNHIQTTVNRSTLLKSLSSKL